MPMYKLPAFLPADFNVQPKNIVYKLASYHGESGEQQSSASSVSLETDPVKVLEQKQLELIERLKKQADSLGKLLASAKPTTAAPQKGAAKESTPQPAQEAPKKDKDAKKEARKAAKNEAKNKVASGDAPAPKKTATSAGSSWTIEDDRKTWETGLSLTANIPSTLVNYPQEPLGQITLTVTKSDLVWVQSLALVGQKRSVSFTGNVTNKVGKDAKTTVNVKTGEEVSLTINKVTIRSRATVWKSLGLALGLFARTSQQVLSSAHQALWLNKSNQVLLKTADLSLLEREASQFLARFDSLSSQWDITLADIIFRSLIKATNTLPNNVEIWAKKIDQLLA
ncbi:unnamed protein product [Caenorhabditis angaria]|uniref:Uncharacterized protein n=1 Tax=Caenorhabditis angaria TaxID=860376 RepID=A0A9P1N3W0_9PELO|nr:unnamed protein product [Caenorhabditis angaria]